MKSYKWVDFPFGKIHKTLENYPSPVTPITLLIIWLDYRDVLARLLRKGDGVTGDGSISKNLFIIAKWKIKK